MINLNDEEVELLAEALAAYGEVLDEKAENPFDDYDEEDLAGIERARHAATALFYRITSLRSA